MKGKILVGGIALALAGAGYWAINNTETVNAYQKRTHLTSSSKAQSWKHAQEFQKMFRADVNTGEIDVRDVLKARERVEFKGAQRASLGLEWAERGPDNVGGRTRALMVDKLDETGNTVYAGSVAGGLFKSTNGCATWTPINDQSDAPSISCIDQGMGGTIYVGTGAQFESFDGSGSSGMIGKGLYKSTDGNTFTILPSTVPAANATSDGWSAINAVAVDPTNDNRVFAATKGGLQVSSDGGSTWSCAATNAIGNCIANVQDVKIADDGTVMIVTSGTVLVSPDGSTGSFSSVTGSETPGGGRTVIKFAPSNNDTAWALSETGGHLRGLYVSTDRGSTWALAQGPVTNIWDENSGLFWR